MEGYLWPILAVLALTGTALALHPRWPAWPQLVFVGPYFVIAITWSTSPWWMRITVIALVILGRYAASRMSEASPQNDD